MADFSALKTSIQNYIKQNGNEEITGNLLQQILLSMVSTLGDSAINDLVTALNAEIANRGNADTELGGRITTLQGVINGIKANVENGYVYAGIATPSATPASGKVFYLALAAGTYTNFGATVVSQGINILKYNGSTWSLDSFLGLDDAPTQGSNNLVKSGGVLDSIIKDGSAFDLSAYNSGATYADLSAALTALNALPAAYKKGGMSVKFARTANNKYVQYRLMSDTFNTTPTNWQGVDDEPKFGSKNLVKSGGVLNVINKNSNSYSLMVASLINTQKHFLKKGDIETTAGYYNIINDEIQLIPADPNTSIRRCIAINCEGLDIVSIKNVGIAGSAYKVIVQYVDDTHAGWSLTNTGDIANLEKEAKILYLNFFDGSDTDGFELSSSQASEEPVENFPTNVKEVDFVLKSEGGYFTYEGNYISSSSYIGCEVDVTPYIGKYLVVYGSVDTEGNITCALLLDGSDNIIGRTKVFYSTKDYEAIYIPDNAVKFCFTKGINDTAYCFVSDVITDYYKVNFGYLNKSDVFTPAAGWRTTDYMPVNTGDKIIMTISCETVCYAIACYGKDKTIIASKSIGGISGVNSYTLTIPEDVSFIRICFYNNVNTIINIIRNTDIQKYYKKYDNIIRKPFDLNGKHAVWFGDSITYGYLAGAENNRTTVPFPKAFSEAVGLSSQFDYGNRGSNGATIVPTTSTQTNNLTNSVTNYPLDYYGTPDIVFVAGGINDLQLGTDWDTFKTGMEAFADAINTKFDASIPVIFITPINARAAILGTSHPLSELVKIRNIMTTEILKKDIYNRFSVIQGDKLPFPLMTEDTAMSDILFSDGVHLSEYGYKVYAAYLQGVLY